MAKAIDGTSYERLRERIFSIARGNPNLAGSSIPVEIGASWRIGQELFWHAEDLLEFLSQELWRECGKAWGVRDLEKSIRLYRRYPTLEGLSARCAGRSAVSLDELLDFEK